MSVLNRLQEFAGGDHEPAQRFGEDYADAGQMQDMEEMMQTAPIPGVSLTQDPENRLPYEKPPEFTNVQEFLDEAFLKLSDPDGLPELLDVMRDEVPVEFIAQKFLMGAFQNGKITPDVLMLSIEPVIYILISLATYADIDPVLYPEDSMVEDLEAPSHTKFFKQTSQDMLAEEDTEEKPSGLTVHDLNAPAVQPKSLLARSQAAVAKVKGG